MKRRHLFEFNDLDWMPAVIKALVTDYLRTVTEMTDAFSPQLPLIARALQHGGESAAVVDLCSGGGGPWRHLGPQLDRLVRRRVSVTLTDKYPDWDALAGLSQPDTVSWHETPVDATDVPPELSGMRTLFNGFHHFRPEAARQILASAVDNNEPVVVMEMLQRRWLDLLLLVFTPLLVWLVTPWTRPFAWRRLLLTYLVPIAPVIILWDTFVSILRCYTPKELQAMGHAVAGDRYEWFAGSYRYSRAPVSYLIGYPLRREAACGGVDSGKTVGGMDPAVELTRTYSQRVLPESTPPHAAGGTPPRPAGGTSQTKGFALHGCVPGPWMPAFAGMTSVGFAGMTSLGFVGMTSPGFAGMTRPGYAPMPRHCKPVGIIDD